MTLLVVMFFLAGCCAGAATAVLATGGRRAGAPAGPEGWGSPSRAPGDKPREGASRCVYGDWEGRGGHFELDRLVGGSD